jgi:hypothetical protein
MTVRQLFSSLRALGFSPEAAFVIALAQGK